MAQLSGLPRLEVHNVKVEYGATVALDDVHLEVCAGQIHALVGENGAGKSTLMKVLSGAIKPDSGKLLLDGKLYCPRNPRDARLLGVYMIYQELSLAPHLTVEENIFLGFEPQKTGLLNRKQMRERTKAILKQLGHVEIPANTQVSRLSLSRQQLVEIARASAFGCRVLILDEPTSSLTQPDVQRLFQLIRRLKLEGCATIYISHFIEEVKEVADQFTVLRDGKTVGTGDASSYSVEQIGSMMIGRQINNLYPHSQRKPGEPILNLTGLMTQTKVRSAELSLHRGEILGIAGLVGSGRTELLRAIFGLDAIKRGEIRVRQDQRILDPVSRWAQGVGFLSENRKEEGLALALSVADNIILTNTNKSRFSFILPPSRREKAGRHWIEALSIRARDPKQKIGELSGGNQQKIALARLLHEDVDILLLDEPTRGIDVGSKNQIYQLMDMLALQNKAILLVSSYLPELLGVCDRIAVMCRGQLGVAHHVKEISEQAIMLEATQSGTMEQTK